MNDDNQPVSEEWLTEVLGEPLENKYRNPWSEWRPAVSVVIEWHHRTNSVHINCVLSEFTTTRGDFRWVCKRLGIQLKEEG